MGNPEPERGVFNLRKPRAKKTVVKSYEVYEMAQHTVKEERVKKGECQRCGEVSQILRRYKEGKKYSEWLCPMCYDMDRSSAQCIL